jgi:hypothetical protein
MPPTKRTQPPAAPACAKAKSQRDRRIINPLDPCDPIDQAIMTYWQSLTGRRRADFLRRAVIAGVVALQSSGDPDFASIDLPRKAPQ